MSIPAAENSPRRHLAAWIIGGVIGLATLLMIGALGLFFHAGISLFNEQAAAAIRADPAVTGAVGNIVAIEFDFTATGNAPGAEDFAYRVSGDRASGLLVGRFVTVDADTEELRSGVLTLDDGRTVRIGTMEMPERDRMNGGAVADEAGIESNRPAD